MKNRKMIVLCVFLIVLMCACGTKKQDSQSEIDVEKEETTLGAEREMIRLKGLTLEEAENEAKRINIKLKNKGETASDYPKDTIAMQSIEKGEIVHEGEEVVIYLSSGNEAESYTTYEDVLYPETYLASDYDYNDIMNNIDNYNLKSVRITGKVQAVSKGSTGYIACVSDKDGNLWACSIASKVAEDSPIGLDGTIYGFLDVKNVNSTQSVPLLLEVQILGAVAEE